MARFRVLYLVLPFCFARASVSESSGAAGTTQNRRRRFSKFLEAAAWQRGLVQTAVGNLDMAHHGFRYSDLAETEVTESKVLKIKFRIYLKRLAVPLRPCLLESPETPKGTETHKSKNGRTTKPK